MSAFEKSTPTNPVPKADPYEHWSASALCREDPDLWYAGEDNRQGRRDVAYAKAQCRRCPVKGPCQADTDDFESPTDSNLWFGIRYGLTVKERKSKRRAEILNARRLVSA